MTPLRELQLVRAHRSGDPEAIGKLLTVYQYRVYSICYRMMRNPEEAADLTQESLLRVLEGLDSYDERAKLSTWVIRVTMNCCLSAMRKRSRRRTTSLDARLESEPHDASPGANLADPGELSGLRRVEQAEVRSRLLAALQRLEPDTRALLVLRDAQGLEYQQIAAVLSVPVGTVKSRLFRARAALRSEMERSEAETIDE
jgi:RNA polymerase sigma-70 factor (ECF subfamily)